MLAAPTKSLRDELSDRLQGMGVNCIRLGPGVDQQDLLYQQIFALHEEQHPGWRMPCSDFSVLTSILWSH